MCIRTTPSSWQLRARNDGWEAEDGRRLAAGECEGRAGAIQVCSAGSSGGSRPGQRTEIYGTSPVTPGSGTTWLNSSGPVFWLAFILPHRPSRANPVACGTVVRPTAAGAAPDCPTPEGRSHRLPVSPRSRLRATAPESARMITSGAPPHKPMAYAMRRHWQGLAALSAGRLAGNQCQIGAESVCMRHAILAGVSGATPVRFCRLSGKNHLLHSAPVVLVLTGATPVRRCPPCSARRVKREQGARLVRKRNSLAAPATVGELTLHRAGLSPSPATTGKACGVVFNDMRSPPGR